MAAISAIGSSMDFLLLIVVVIVVVGGGVKISIGNINIANKNDD